VSAAPRWVSNDAARTVLAVAAGRRDIDELAASVRDQSVAGS
jgi:hypothetical protein